MTGVPAPIVPAERHLRLLSCNILAGGSVQRYSEYVTRSLSAMLPGRSKMDNLDRLAEVLAQFDVIGLQEADAGSLRSGLISRLKPQAVLDYPLPSRIPGRGALLAQFGEGDNALAVMIAHLSLSSQARSRQLGFIAELLQDFPHAVLMGDLNAEPGSVEMKQLFAKSTLQPPTQNTPTFPSWKPRRALDHILTSPGITLEKTWALPQAFSDHLPLAAEISLPASVGGTGSTRRQR